MKKPAKRPKPHRGKPLPKMPLSPLVCRRYRVKPDLKKRYVVEVFISRNRRNMHENLWRAYKCREHRWTAGLCRHWTDKNSGKTVPVANGVIAHIHLNAVDLAKSPGEIISHECGHAAMAWARFRKANLDIMKGEEIMCYALGVLTNQVNNVYYAYGVRR